MDQNDYFPCRLTSKLKIFKSKTNKNNIFIAERKNC